MKRKLCFILALAMTISLVGCGGSDKHEGEAKTPSASSAQNGRMVEDVVSTFEKKGFTNIQTEPIYDLITGWLTKDGEVEAVSVDGDTEYSPDVWYPADVEVIISYHTFMQDDPSDDENGEVTDSPDAEEPDSSETDEPIESETSKEPSSLTYSTNTLEEAKNGNSGVFSYKCKGTNYDIYWIVDFDEDCAYYFTYGNGNSSCDRVQIDSGDLNEYIVVTYHDGEDSWQYGLHFKRKNQPDRLIQQDTDGETIEFVATGLDDALKIRDSMTIVDY